MEGVLAIALILAVGLVAGAYRLATRTAGHVMLAAAVLWGLGVALLALNGATFPTDETLREAGEGLAILPLLIAAPLTVAAIVLTIAGLARKRAV